MELWILIVVLVAAMLLVLRALRPRRPALPDDTLGQATPVENRGRMRDDDAERLPKETPAASGAGARQGGADADLTAEAAGGRDPLMAYILNDIRRIIAEDDADRGAGAERGGLMRPEVAEADGAHTRDLVADIERLISEEDSQRNAAIASGLVSGEGKAIEDVACEVLQLTWGWTSPLAEVHRLDPQSFPHLHGGVLDGPADTAKWLSWRWQGVQFRFVLTIEPEALDDRGDAGVFHLWADGKEVLRLDVHRLPSGDVDEWQPSALQSLAEGPWVAILHHFAEWLRLATT